MSFIPNPIRIKRYTLTIAVSTTSGTVSVAAANAGETRLIELAGISADVTNGTDSGRDCAASIAISGNTVTGTRSHAGGELILHVAVYYIKNFFIRTSGSVTTGATASAAPTIAITAVSDTEKVMLLPRGFQQASDTTTISGHLDLYALSMASTTSIQVTFRSASPSGQRTTVVDYVEFR